MHPGPQLEEAIALVHKAAESAGRDPASLGMEGRVGLSSGLDAATEEIAEWRSSGATHVVINSMGMGAGGIDRHIGALAEVARAIGLPAKEVS